MSTTEKSTWDSKQDMSTQKISADASTTAKKDSRKSLRKLMTLRSNKKKQRSKSMLKT
jgi:hypothetical protein